jgi:hypothetical protein
LRRREAATLFHASFRANSTLRIHLQISSDTPWQDWGVRDSFLLQLPIISWPLPDDKRDLGSEQRDIASNCFCRSIAGALATSADKSHPHARRRSIGRNTPSTPSFPSPTPIAEHKRFGATSGLPAQASDQPVRPIPGTASPATPMSLSRSPSPRLGGGWSTPGLTDDCGYGTPGRREYGDLNGSASNDSAWAAAKARSSQVRNTPSFTTRNEGFFSRQKRKISATLPRFNSFGPNQKDWNAEKLGRGRWRPTGGGKWSRLKTLVGNLLRKFKFLFVMLALIVFTTLLWSKSSECTTIC